MAFDSKQGKYISIVIPTYNENDNIQPLTEKIHQVLGQLNYEIVIIDDNSNDGTAETANRLSRKYPVRTIVRKNEKGLASAVVRGFSEAEGEIIGVMDADLQHPPEILMDMISTIQKSADVAVASRYIEGGGCKDWGLLRRFESKVATFIANLLLPGTRNVKDPMSGYFMVTRKSVEAIDLKPKGYKILLEILVKAKNLKTVEVPFVFQTRERGSSKLNIRQQIDYLMHIYQLMRTTNELTRFLKYCLVGGSGIIVDEGIFWLLISFTGIFNVLAAAISAEVAIISNYTLNSFFTFADRSSGGIRSFFSRLLKFNLVCVSGIGIKLAVFWILTLIFGDFDLIFNLCGIAVATIWNYTVNTWWTWK
jgi:dolichol-phosphate mannosyltransferase